MSAPLTHATVWGWTHLRSGLMQERDTPDWVRACDGARCSDSTGRDITLIPADYLRNTIPTCPRCAVLRDAALEGRAVTT
jgi:hypothetical protein